MYLKVATSLQTVARRPRRSPHRSRANCEDSHGTVARAIRHAQSPQRVARSWGESQKKTILAHAHPKNRKEKEKFNAFLHINHTDPRRGPRALLRTAKNSSFCASTTPIPAENCARYVRMLKKKHTPRAHGKNHKQKQHFTACLPVHASMRFTLYLPYACLYAFHCLLSLRMPPCITLSTFPAHASLHVTACSQCARHLCTCLSTCSLRASHFTAYFPCACISAFHSALALCMHQCISLCTCPICIALSTFPLHASMHSFCTCPMHFTVYFPHACPITMHFAVYFPYAVKLCRTQRLYRKNHSQCFGEKQATNQTRHVWLGLANFAILLFAASDFFRKVDLQLACTACKDIICLENLRRAHKYISK